MEQAARLFLVKGYAATTTRDIAAAADMQSGSPYYFFQNKQAMLHAVMQEGMARVIATQAEVLKALTGAQQQQAAATGIPRTHQAQTRSSGA